MLFNSLEFLLIFLPITTLIYYFLLFRYKKEAHLNFLIIASLFFYGWWEPKYLILICLSIGINYLSGLLIIKSLDNYFYKKFFLIIGIIFNLSLLFYYKYMFFMMEIFDSIFEFKINFLSVVLPLGISFFTFQQIAFLVDIYNEEKFNKKINYYFLFITFFPQLIAGPIVHHKEIIEQYSYLKLKIQVVWKNLSLGLTLITIGLFKKVLLADKLAIWVDRAFNYSANEGTLTFIESWINVFFFSFQIYFDFSAYSDIALGLALLFGLKLPINFFSPYRATNVIEFWRLWHITLSSFLKNYLYIPLGGNKKGKSKQLVNLLIVMLLGGVWHGAGWTFILWGLTHGLLLSINHIMQYIKSPFYNNYLKKNYNYICLCRLFTFVLVTMAWVLFRAENVDSAINIYLSLLGFNGISLPTHYEILIGDFAYFLKQLGVSFKNLPNYGGGVQIIWLVFMFFWIWFLPNSIELMSKYNVFLETKDFKFKLEKSLIKWIPNKLYSIFFSFIFIFIIIKIFQGQEGEFIYFQF